MKNVELYHRNSSARHSTTERLHRYHVAGIGGLPRTTLLEPLWFSISTRSFRTNWAGIEEKSVFHHVRPNGCTGEKPASTSKTPGCTSLERPLLDCHLITWTEAVPPPPPLNRSRRKKLADDSSRRLLMGCEVHGEILATWRRLRQDIRTLRRRSNVNLRQPVLRDSPKKNPQRLHHLTQRETRTLRIHETRRHFIGPRKRKRPHAHA